MDTTLTDSDLIIEPTHPFDLSQSLAFLDGFIPCAGDHTCHAGRLTTGGYADSHPFVAVVADSGDTLAVTVDWVGETGDPEAVADWLRGFLSLDDDLAAFYETASSDPAFAPVVDDLHGYHHVRFSTPFEAACWAALSQRTPMPVARNYKRRLVEVAGRIETVEGTEVSLFPTPAAVEASSSDVEAAIDHDRKSKTVLAAATCFANEDLASMDDAALRDRLADIWGFGDWSSEFIALRGFGRLSGLPRSEDRLREVVADRYGLDGAASDADLDRLSEPYAPQIGYWAHYLRVWAFQQSQDDP